MEVTRREFVAGSAAACLVLGPESAAETGPTTASPAVPSASSAPARPFVWQPERSPSGTVLLIVSIPEQRVHVYRGGIEIGNSPCSTGKPGHRTPTGVFTILEKERRHVSSIYKGAQMPNMERLTWTGIALHAGNLPGYPASHGCVRLPLEFSALLFDVTQLGAAVIIADVHTQPANVVHPGLLMPSVAGIEASAVVETVKRKGGGWQPVVNYPLTTVLISRSEGMAYITSDGRLTASYPAHFANLSKPIGTHAYSLLGPAADGTGLLWLTVGIGKTPHEAHVVNWSGDTALRRVSFDDMKRARAIAESFHPGTLILLTDAPAPRSTRETAKDFKVIASDHAA